MFKKSFMTVAAAAAVLGLSSLAQAVTLPSEVTVSGTFSPDSTQFLSLSFDGALKPSVAGALHPTNYITITGYNKNLSVNVGASVSKVVFDTVLISGAPYSRAHLYTKNFYFVDLTTNTRVLATAEAIFTTYGQYGTICFDITNAKTKVSLVKTCNNAGNLTDLPLTTSTVVIK